MAYNTPTALTDLRRRAELNLSRLVKQSIPNLSPEHVQTLVHELQVHEIEVEMQCQELQRANHEIEESRTRYRELYESIPIGYVTIDMSGRMYDVNPAGGRLLGIDETKRVLNNFFFFFYDDDVDRITLSARRVIEQKIIETGEYQMKRTDNGGFTAFLQAVPVQSGEGKEARIRVAFQDITQQKKTEAQLHRQQVELESNQAELRELTRKLFAAQEEERRRIASELHDDYCQRITAVILETGSISRSYQGSAPSLVPRMNTIRGRLAEILDGFRHLSHELHPTNIDTVSIASSLRNLIREISSHGTLGIEFKEEAVPASLPISITMCLYRLLQESLNNVRKHANASRVVVRLIGTSDEVKLQISDDGMGFETNRPAEGGKGIGLTSMQERVRPLRGTVSIESHAGHGTTVTAVIPLSHNRSVSI